MGPRRPAVVDRAVAPERFQIVAAVDRIGIQGERLLIWFFSLIALLVMAITFGIMLTMLTYKHFAARMAAPRFGRVKEA
ncbi:MAG: hypothetical protein U1F76_03185 [Candidatus Competibacteraceae bacterium]